MHTQKNRPAFKDDCSAIGNILYIDPISGISGDMFLAACVDLGVDRDSLVAKLQSLQVDFFSIAFHTVLKNGIRALSTHIELHPHTNDAMHSHLYDSDLRNHSNHRHLQQIDDIITSSGLSTRVKKLAREIFMLIAEAEASIHNTNIDDVHFHEVGAMDSILDIIGAAICVDELHVEQIVCGYVPTGYGSVTCEHGLFPVPAPATLELLKGVPIRNIAVASELTTPTGAAIIKAIATSYSPQLPDMKVTAIGYGAGNKTFDHPNVLRLVLGECLQTTIPISEDSLLWVLEASIDDMQPEFYQHSIDRILAVGARDALLIPAIMKKDRSGSILQVIAEASFLPIIKETIFKETTTFGIRSWQIQRDILEREFFTVSVREHLISIKVGRYNNQIVTVSPEYEDCKRVALATEIPLKSIYQEALEKWALMGK